MRIHTDFTGANATVQPLGENSFFAERELRDTSEDWFYWAFCVEGAAGKTLSFRFAKNRLGYYGPAVCHDLKEWHWLNSVGEDSFSYTFAKEENCVYFAHSMLYHPNRFFALAEENGWQIAELCKSRKGRSVPCITMGNGSRNILLTARHHACESTGNYVLEGVLEQYSKNPIPDTNLFCVPFVDFDGVVEGDQGKSRIPHDHNRDYDIHSQPIYPEVRAIREYADKNGVTIGCDFHSPWHISGENDTVFIPQKSLEKKPRLDRFGEILQSQITDTSLKYFHENDFAPGKSWNQVGTPCFASYMLACPGNDIAFTLETTYFGDKDNIFSQERAIELGHCFTEALRSYLKK